MQTITFDRSRNEAFCKCPRLRFLSYEYPPNQDHPEAPNGLQRVAHAVPLLTGGMIHKAIEFILTGYDVNAAVANALAAYDEAIEKRGIDVEEMAPEPTWIVKVQRALIEALVRGWEAYTLPRILDEYEVLDVEHEERAEFIDGDTKWIMLARADAIVKRRSDGLLFIRNPKTISELKDYKIKGYRYDTQTISEVLAVEQRLDQKVSGVIYDFLIKGKKAVQYPRNSGVWHNSSPLIWCYWKEGQTGIESPEVASRWDYECSEPHKQGNGHLCMGGKFHKLGKGWGRMLVTDAFPNGIVDWFAWLEEFDPALIRDQFQTIPAIERTPFDVTTFMQGVLPEEARIAASAEVCRDAIRRDGFVASLPILDHHFPKHTHNSACLFPSRCSMLDVCWGATGTLDDIPESELYMYREPHHPEQIYTLESE
jgi:hypothetical protein